MDTIITLKIKTQMPSGDTECAYGIKTRPVQDYRLIQVELQDSLLTGGPEGKSILPWTRLRKRLARKRQEQVVADFQRELAGLLDERDDNYLVKAGKRADRLLEGVDVQKLIPLPLFEGYLERRWVRRLLPYAIYPHFVVLGTVPYLPELLCELAPRMKSLLWILPDHLHGEMLEDFAEDFYQEYGLAINLRHLCFNGSYGQLRVEENLPGEPVNILDFTEDRRIPSMRPQPGSIWLDLAAEEEKERRMETRKLGTTYFSLKKLWEHPQNAPYLLDTTRKNRYNTVS